jgi:hypothetical protein
MYENSEVKDALLELQITQKMNLTDQNKTFVNKMENIRRLRGGKYMMVLPFLYPI